MTGLAQSKRIPDTARHRNIGARRSLGQLGQPHAIAGKPRTIIGKNHFEFVIAGNRPDTTGQSPFERLRIDR